MRSKANLPVFLAYAVISLLVLAYLAAQMGGEFLLQPGYRVKAVFGSGAQLVAGDDVTINGFRVGKVDSLQASDAGAQAVLLIHERYAPLFRDARAMVKSKNLLGETYVELWRGTPSSGPLPRDGTIDKSHTLTPVELDRVLDTLNADTRQRLTLLINTLGESVGGRGQDLNASAGDLRIVAQALQSVAQSVATQSADLDTLISSLRKVLDTLAAWHSQFRSLVTDWDRLMRTLASRESDLQGLFVQQDRVMAIFDQALAGSNSQDLHDVIAGGPQLLDDGNHYLDNSQQSFGTVAADSTAVTDLFYELASVMSGQDASGQHYWRVYPVGGGQNTIGVPCQGGGTQPPGCKR